MEFSIAGKKIYRYIMPVIESNMYIALENKEALIIDPNINREALELLHQHCVQTITVLLTHEHYDHISGVNWLREHFITKVICAAPCASALQNPDRNMARFWNILVMDKPGANSEEAARLENLEYRCMADQSYDEALEFLWQGHPIRMQQAPGHSKGGSLIWLDGNILFSGDNLVNGAGVICRFPGGSKKEYSAMTRPILESLPNDINVFPGHGEPERLENLRLYLNYFGKVPSQ